MMLNNSVQQIVDCTGKLRSGLKSILEGIDIDGKQKLEPYIRW